jgi:hydrogenase expression/formation protein HypC
MCLGIPGKVVETYDEHGVRMGKVDFGGVRKRVCLAHTPDVTLGQYVIVHVGFSLNVVDEDEAAQIFHFLDRMNELGELEHDGLKQEEEQDREHKEETVEADPALE